MATDWASPEAWAEVVVHLLLREEAQQAFCGLVRLCFQQIVELQVRLRRAQVLYQGLFAESYAAERVKALLQRCGLATWLGLRFCVEDVCELPVAQTWAHRGIPVLGGRGEGSRLRFLDSSAHLFPLAAFRRLCL